MDEKIMKTLLRKATGYSFDEVVEEYAVKDDGAVELTKRKVTTKHYPADSTALKACIELSSASDVSKLEDDELQREKMRLLKELKEKEHAKNKKNTHANKAKMSTQNKLETEKERKNEESNSK